MLNSRMAGRRDEVQQGVHSVVFEARITLDPGLHSQDVVVLALEVPHNFLEAGESAGLVFDGRCEPNQARTQTRCRCYHRSQGCRRWSGRCGRRLLRALKKLNARQARRIARRKHSAISPTFTGLMRMPSSMCAVSELSANLCGRTSESQSVFTNVVRPVPEAPGSRTAVKKSSAGRGCFGGRTDDHDGELDTLLSFVSSSAWNHGEGDELCVGWKGSWGSWIL